MPGKTSDADNAPRGFAAWLQNLGVAAAAGATKLGVKPLAPACGPSACRGVVLRGEGEVERESTWRGTITLRGVRLSSQCGPTLKCGSGSEAERVEGKDVSETKLRAGDFVPPKRALGAGDCEGDGVAKQVAIGGTGATLPNSGDETARAGTIIGTRTDMASGTTVN